MVEIDLISVEALELTWFYVAVENDLVLVSGPKLTLFLCRGIQIDLKIELGSKLTLFQWWGRN